MLTVLLVKDARDAAEACLASLHSKRTGHHQYLIAAADTCMRKPNSELVKHSFPNVEYTPTKGDNDTLLAIDKARRELRWEPKWSWKDMVKS